nr:ankyrin repeat domain-containing protein [Endozoicomonas sp.]
MHVNKSQYWQTTTHTDQSGSKSDASEQATDKVQRWFDTQSSTQTSRSGSESDNDSTPHSLTKRSTSPCDISENYLHDTSSSVDSHIKWETESCPPTIYHSPFETEEIIDKIPLCPSQNLLEQARLAKNAEGHWYLIHCNEKTPFSKLVDDEKLLLTVKHCLLNGWISPIEYSIKNKLIDPAEHTYFDKPLIHAAITSKQSGFVKFLLEGNYVDINQLDSRGDSPLITAVLEDEENQNTQMVDLLLPYNPNLEIKDILKKTALETAACCLKSVDLTQRLLENNANPIIITELPVVSDDMSKQEKADIHEIRKLLISYGWEDKSFDTALKTKEIPL